MPVPLTPVFRSRTLRPTLAHALWLSTAFTAAGILAAAGLSHQPAPQSPPAEPAPKPDPLARVAFLAGQWSSNSPDGFVEEIWSPPHASSIMGVFRWCKPAPDSSPAMFEILTITSEGADIYLRLRHFTPALAAKEEKDAPMTLKLLAPEPGATPSTAVFVAHANAGKLSKITYERTKDDSLLIEVAFTPESQRDPLQFNLSRSVSPR